MIAASTLAYQHPSGAIADAAAQIPSKRRLGDSAMPFKLAPDTNGLFSDPQALEVVKTLDSTSQQSPASTITPVGSDWVEDGIRRTASNSNGAHQHLDYPGCLGQTSSDSFPSKQRNPSSQSGSTQNEFDPAFDQQQVATSRTVNGDETNVSELRRTNNRLAAGKYRSKQKRQRDALQKHYQQSINRNKQLKRQERLLRENIVFLKDCALQHDPTRCGCAMLHKFNLRRAEHFSTGSGSSSSKQGT